MGSEKSKKSEKRMKAAAKMVLPKNIRARIARSLMFWGLAAVLAFSVYRGISERAAGVKIVPGDAVREEVIQEDTAQGSEVQKEMIQEDMAQGSKVQEEMIQEDMAQERNTMQKTESEREMRIALTFDDGPHPVYTKMLLDGLAERDVKASFFIVGKNIPGNEDLIARMEEEGHLIGNHTYDHVKICSMSGEDACRQVEKTSALVREITGHDTEFIRPPFGAWNKEMECSFTMIPVLWDVDPLDWTTKNTALVEERILKNVQGGDIILLHDLYQSSVEAALGIIDRLKAQGYEFVTVDQLILE